MYVYVIKSKNDRLGAVKIGYTSHSNFSYRIKALQTGCPFKLEFELVLPGTSKDEAAIHRRFKPYRLVGEWFERSFEVDEFIKEEKRKQKRDGTRLA